MATLSPLDELAAYVTHTTYAEIPGDVSRHAKLVVLDTLGVILAGSEEEENRALASFALASPAPQATVLTRGLPLAAAESAAFVNGTAAVYLEMDEGHRFFGTHAGVHVVPAALAVAELEHASGAELLTAIVVGYDVAARIGGAITARPEINGHGTWGIVGAAAACAKLLKLSPEETRSALKLASHLLTATAVETSLGGATVRNAYVGMAGQAGIRAVQLARAGFTPLADPVPTIFGRIIGTGFDPDVLHDGLGERYEITRNFFKLHACCQWNHAALDAAETALADGGVSWEQVESVDIITHHHAARMSAVAPVSPLQAKFSLPYALAARLVLGHTRPEAFDREAIRDPRILDVAKRVRVLEDARMSAGFPFDRSAEVRIRTVSGDERAAYCENARGDFRRPHAQALLEEKFAALAGLAVTTETARVLQACIGDLDNLDDVTEMTANMRATG